MKTCKCGKKILFGELCSDCKSDEKRVDKVSSWFKKHNEVEKKKGSDTSEN